MAEYTPEHMFYLTKANIGLCEDDIASGDKENQLYGLHWYIHEKWMKNPLNLLTITELILLTTSVYLDHIKHYAIYNVIGYFNPGPDNWATSIIQFRQFVIVSEVSNITEIVFSVNVTISDIKIWNRFCAQIRQYVQIAICFKTDITLKKKLKPYHYSLVWNKIMNIFIFFASLRKVLWESSIYTRDIFRDARIVKY